MFFGTVFMEKNKQLCYNEDETIWKQPYGNKERREKNMKERMIHYLENMDAVLLYLTEEEAGNKELMNRLYEDHMNQIYFFMHERLVHLIVTVLFAIGTFMTIFTYLIVDNPVLLLLAFLLIVLLIPYISHYYLLENGVQKMYRQYDALKEKENF